MKFRQTLILLLMLAVCALTGCQNAPTAVPAAAPTAAPAVTVLIVTATPAPATATPIPSATPVPPTATSVPPTATVAPTEAPAGAMLEIMNGDVTKKLTVDELKKLTVSSGWAGIKSSTGKITPPSQFKGVSLLDLAKLVGDFNETLALNVVAKDGYAMTFSYDQVMGKGFTTFDPGTGDEVVRNDPLTLIVAYEREGQAIPEETDGTLRLAIISAKNNQVTDGHWAVKWVRQVIVKPASAEWTLHLEGALVEEMDRNTFESGAAPNCHLAEWVDENGVKWGGIPLYYLMGRVDDVKLKHEGDAFDVELAQKGYKVDVVAADGYKVTFDSAPLIRNKAIILANTADGKPLDDKVFPLRLVGSGLKKAEMVGAVAQIVLHLDGAPAEAAVEPTHDPTKCAQATATAAAAKQPTAPTAAAPEMKAGVLHIWGKVAKPIAYDLAALKQVGMTKISAEHPKKGMTEYEGVRLNDLLAQVQPAAEATKLVITSGDGYVTEVLLADVKACADCLIAVDGETFNAVMPGLSSGAWAKDARIIEVK